MTTIAQRLPIRRPRLRPLDRLHAVLERRRFHRAVSRYLSGR